MRTDVQKSLHITRGSFGASVSHIDFMTAPQAPHGIFHVSFDRKKMGSSTESVPKNKQKTKDGQHPQSRAAVHHLVVLVDSSKWTEIELLDAVNGALQSLDESLVFH